MRLHQRKAAYLQQTYRPSAPRDELIMESRQLANAALDALIANSAPPLERGLREEAYLSQLDDSAQPFVRYLPSSYAPTNAPPLLLYLHGYTPTLDLVNWALIPPVLTNLAEQTGACLAAPFGRSNTDFQGIGEQDVLRVADEMHARYGTDTNRIVLCGYSMGGMGAWTIGARFAERFCGLLILCGRGDYYLWHELERERVPPWQRRLIDAAFVPDYLERLRNLPVLAWHGRNDSLIRFDEAESLITRLRKINPQAELRPIAGEDHWIAEIALAQPATLTWLKRTLRYPPAVTNRPAALQLRPGETPSRLQNAFLEPFVLLRGQGQTDLEGQQAFARRAREWEEFAKAPPRIAYEGNRHTDWKALSLIAFGEPESSPTVARILAAAGVKIAPDTFTLGGRALPRREHGLWLALPSPFAPGRTAVAQCGVAWGEALSPNHRYDLLPDVIVYRAMGLMDPFPPVVAAGFIADDGRVEWLDAPSPSALP